MSHHDLTVLLLALGILVGAARALGEVATSLRQPAVLGELMAGVILGPTVLGALSPGTMQALFPPTGPVAIALQGLTTVAVVLFLLVAGLEVDLSRIRKQGRVASTVSAFGILAPFGVGFAAAWAAPELMGMPPGGQRPLFALFLATALSISALPVIAKILMDLKLFRTDLGMVVLAAAIVNDFIGWMIFAVVLGLIPGRHVGEDAIPVGTTLTATVLFALVMLTAGRALLHRAIVWVQAHAAWPAGVLTLCVSLALLCGAFTEWIGVHAIFGALLVGVALGDSSHLRERTRIILHHFVSAFFAPLFFATIGLRVDFVKSFDPALCLLMVLIASLGKILGCGLGARLAGMPHREAWAVGFGMNARGAMEIILGLLAREAGLIDDRMLVALVVMALATSMISGPLMQRALGRRNPARFGSYLRERAYRLLGPEHDRAAAVGVLAHHLASVTGRPEAAVAEAIAQRERMTGGQLVPGVWLAHGRLDGLAGPVVGIALCREGFTARVSEGPVNALVLLLTPKGDEELQMELLADLARTFLDAEMYRTILGTSSAVELRAALRTAHAE